MHERQSFALYFLYHDAQYILLPFFVFGQEYESRTVFALFGHRYSLQQNEFMWNLEHYARSVAGLVVGSLCTSVAHVFQHLQCIVHKFVALVAMDIDNHPHSTCIMLVAGRIQSFYHIWLFLSL